MFQKTNRKRRKIHKIIVIIFVILIVHSCIDDTKQNEVKTTSRHVSTENKSNKIIPDSNFTDYSVDKQYESNMVDVEEYLYQPIEYILERDELFPDTMFGSIIGYKLGDAGTHYSVYLGIDNAGTLESVDFYKYSRFGFHKVMIGMDLDNAIQCLSNGYYTYFNNIDLVFWAQSDVKICGIITIDEESRVESMQVFTEAPDDLIYLENDGADYVILKSIFQRLTKEDIQYLDLQGLKEALDEIYARRGMIFFDEGKNEYFLLKPWYRGVIKEDEFTNDMLSDIDQYNIEFLQEQIEEYSK